MNHFFFVDCFYCYNLFRVCMFVCFRHSCASFEGELCWNGVLKQFFQGDIVQHDKSFELYTKNTEPILNGIQFSSCVPPFFRYFFFLSFGLVWLSAPLNRTGRQSVQLWLMRVHAVLQSLPVSLGVFCVCVCACASMTDSLSAFHLHFVFSRHWMQSRV